MKKLLVFLALFIGILSTPQHSFAASSYVLPYPSTMPGSISYKLHLVWEKIMQYWYFGDFGQFEYNLNESDKYLVEAKTLFEYNQYLLGDSALQKSNAYFQQVLPHLQQAKAHGKDSSDKRAELRLAAEKHMEVLRRMEQETPATATWTPEKTTATILQLHNDIEQAIVIRKSDL